MTRLNSSPGSSPTCRPCPKSDLRAYPRRWAWTRSPAPAGPPSTVIKLVPFATHRGLRFALAMAVPTSPTC
eukprot:scaffold21825_cov82-Phaeocystis_antarctica.AAC.1